MNLLLGAIAGYILHDALQPTVVGKTLDKVSLPSDLFVKNASPAALGQSSTKLD